MKKLAKKNVTEENSCYIHRSSRTIYVIGEITQRLASKFRRLLRSIPVSGSGEPVTVEINSPGGDIEAGLMMIDTMDLSKHTIVTRATGVAQSMASVLLACGHQREALPNACIMVHQGTYTFEARANEIHAETEEARRLNAVYWSILEARTKKPGGYWQAKCDGRNLYLSAYAALELGLIDRICEKEKA